MLEPHEVKWGYDYLNNKFFVIIKGSKEYFESSGDCMKYIREQRNKHKKS